MSVAVVQWTANRLGFPPIWLRDNCPCAECRDPRNGQKFFGIGDLPDDLVIDSVEQTRDTVTVTFAPDGHVSEFDATWLRSRRTPDEGDGRTERSKQLWAAPDLAGALPVADWTTYADDAGVKAATLRDVVSVGFALLRGTPTTERTVLGIAETFGYVRVTNYGELFDVRVKPDPNNLAFTGLGIAPHTDNPYRDPVPTLQLLHCLENAAEGGESGLVDGFQAAALLREESPEAFEVLTATPVTFAWGDADTSLRADRPLIQVDGNGELREVRFNNRSMAALRLSPDRAARFYDAYRAFAEVISRPELLLTFRLDPGDCLIFDNSRLLHARTAFAESGSRHLQGCYADLDGLISTLNVLEARA